MLTIGRDRHSLAGEIDLEEYRQADMSTADGVTLQTPPRKSLVHC
jgi:hypothetical protein